jgi:hypothetical protein
MHKLSNRVKWLSTALTLRLQMRPGVYRIGVSRFSTGSMRSRETLT